MMTSTSHPGDHVDARADARLDELLRREVVEPGVAPSAVVAFARRDADGGWRGSIGACGAARNAIFDLASVTKPLTALSAMWLVAQGTLALDATVADVLPELDDTAAARARLDDLLSHRAGLPSWGALYRADPWSATVEVSMAPDALAEVPLEVLLRRAASRRQTDAIGPSAPSLYSDLGYVLVGAMIARVTNRPLFQAWEALSGATSAGRLRAREPDFDARVLPTEHVPWRSGDVRGVVHDENAFMLERAGGDPGHAGAFATLDDVLSFSARFVDALDGLDGVDPLLPSDLSATMIAPRALGSHRLGWDGVTVGASSSGTHFGGRSFGHLGFTGTSVWIDPDARVVAVLLTNRSYPTRKNVAIRAARPRVHDALFELCR